MKKMSMLVGLFVLCMTLFTGNLYAACNVVRGKIEVSQGTGSSCSSIQSAVNAADGVNPVLVSVLPGTYSEIVTMKPFVTLVGSGQENTKVTSASVGSANYCASKGTVVMDSNTRLENIAVENTNASACRVAINVTDKTSVIIDRVTATTSGSVSSAPTEHGAILVTGTSVGTLNILNSTASVSGSGSMGYSGGIVLFPHNSSSGNSVITVDNVVSSCAVPQASWCNGLVLWSPANLNISNSSFSASGGSLAAGMELYGSASSTIQITNVNAMGSSASEIYGIDIGSGVVSIDRSRAVAIGIATSFGAGLTISGGAQAQVNNSVLAGDVNGLRTGYGFGSGTIDVNNCKIISTGGNFGINKYGDGLIKIGASLIGGGASGPYNGLNPDTDKIVNCHDGNYNQIPNL